MGNWCYIKISFNEMRNKCNGFRPFAHYPVTPWPTRHFNFAAQFNVHQNSNSSSADELQSSGMQSNNYL